jgi:hypothetical protein
MAKSLSPKRNFDNMTPEGIVDELGKLSIVENFAKKERKILREVLFAKLGVDPATIKQQIVNGENFFADIQNTPVTRLDQTAFREAEPETFAKYQKTGDVLYVRPKIKEGTLKPEAQKLANQILAELDMEELADA